MTLPPLENYTTVEICEDCDKEWREEFFDACSRSSVLAREAEIVARLEMIKEELDAIDCHDTGAFASVLSLLFDLEAKR